ncbi:MAG TPA: hypothetical protein PLJ25_03110 [Methanothrix sp.]|nr:hypothetical protein [Methanothrix sp.]
MPGMSVSGDKGNGEENTCYIWSGLKDLMHNKYGDLILLCSVTAAFGLLLVFSAAS